MLDGKPRYSKEMIASLHSISLSPSLSHSPHLLVTRRQFIFVDPSQTSGATGSPCIPFFRPSTPSMSASKYGWSEITAKAKRYFRPVIFPPPRTEPHGETRLPFGQTATRRVFSLTAPPLLCHLVPVRLHSARPLGLPATAFAVLDSYCLSSGLVMSLLSSCRSRGRLLPPCPWPFPASGRVHVDPDRLPKCASS